MVCSVELWLGFFVDTCLLGLLENPEICFLDLLTPGQEDFHNIRKVSSFSHRLSDPLCPIPALNLLTLMPVLVLWSDADFGDTPHRSILRLKVLPS